MISLELAKELKEAGLEWEPQIYDYFDGPNGIEPVESLHLLDGMIEMVNDCRKHWVELLWLPTLSQLLTEIEQRGYGYDLYTNTPYQDDYAINLWHEGCQSDYAPVADTPEAAAAAALIWILREGKE